MSFPWNPWINIPKKICEYSSPNLHQWEITEIITSRYNFENQCSFRISYSHVRGHFRSMDDSKAVVSPKSPPQPGWWFTKSSLEFPKELAVDGNSAGQEITSQKYFNFFLLLWYCGGSCNFHTLGTCEVPLLPKSHVFPSSLVLSEETQILKMLVGRRSHKSGKYIMPRRKPDVWRWWLL